MSTITASIDLALKALNDEDVVAIPTETVYGLAGKAQSDTAIDKIFTLKNRPRNHPLIMHVAKDWDLTPWVASVPDYAQRLMDKFWPGALTLIFQINPCAYPLFSRLNGGLATIAIRCPSHPVTQTLLKTLDFPLAAPSANPFGKISPTTSLHVQQSFADEPLLILEGGRCELGIESTIVAATNPDGFHILRHGSINETEIQQALPAIPAISVNLPVSGNLKNHYQPEKPLYLFKTRDDLQYFKQTNPDTYALFFTPSLNAASIIDTATVADSNDYYFPQNPEQMAFELYYQLRNADLSCAKKIAVELPPEHRSWDAIRERLLKASIKSL